MLNKRAIDAYIRASKLAAGIAADVGVKNGIANQEAMQRFEEVIDDVADVLTAALALYNDFKQHNATSQQTLHNFFNAIASFEG